MTKQNLSETIRGLRAELDKAPSIDAEIRERVKKVLDEIEALAGGEGEIPSQQHTQFLERLKESTQHFEESHASLTLAVGRVIDALSGIGI
ncbi:MAG: DUF4404 family protein [bacterium]